MSAADSLFTPSVQRVLGAVLADPSRTSYIKELVTIADRGTAGCSVKLKSFCMRGYLYSLPADFAATTTLAPHAVTATVTADVAAEVTKRAGTSTVFGATGTTFHFAF